MSLSMCLSTSLTADWPTLVQPYWKALMRLPLHIYHLHLLASQRLCSICCAVQNEGCVKDAYSHWPVHSVLKSALE